MTNNIIQKGHLDVGDGHQIYFEEWGNKDAMPIVHFHGGPGYWFDDHSKAIYDPTKHHVLFFEQRGCGRSTPLGGIEHNTTEHTLKDVEKLLSHIGYNGPVYSSGGSWGCALALMYAIANPQKVQAILVRSIFLASSEQVETTFADHRSEPDFYFTEEYEEFISHVPEDRRKDGLDVVNYFAEFILGDDEADSKKYGDIMMFYKHVLSGSKDFDKENAKKTFSEWSSDPKFYAMTKILTYYIVNNFFIPDNYIVDNAHSISHILCIAVQGKKDKMSPKENVAALKERYGSNFDLKLIDSGHLVTDENMTNTLKEAALKLFV